MSGPGSTSLGGLDLSHRDESIRVQDDLYGHVNGGWLATAQIPADRSRYGAFHELREQAEADLREILDELLAEPPEPGTSAWLCREIYASFLDAEQVEALGTEPLKPMLARVDAVTDLTGLAGEIGALSRSGVAGLFAWFVTTDAGASDRYALYLHQGGLGLPDESYYREDRFAEIRTSYAAHVERMLRLAGRPDPGAEAEAALAVERRLASAHWNRVDSRDVQRTFNKVSRAELAEAAPALDWDAWQAGLGAPDVALADVVLRQPSFLTGVDAALRELDLPAWRAWLAWQTVRAFAPYLPVAFAEAHFDFFEHTLTGVPTQRERWKRGVALVERSVGDALGQLYVARHFPPEAKARISELVDNLVAAYHADISALDWMGPQTRARALEKLAKFTPKVGYPDRWRDYTGLVVDRADLLGNVSRSNAHETDRELGKIGRAVDRDEWLTTPQTVNAFYNPGMNEILFPAAILQPPFFDPAADDAVNYGGIGAVIGHEIGHGFDDQGSRFDGDGNLVDWWTAEDRERFDARAQALIEQFNALSPRDAPGHTVNGALTVGENIGDLGGVTVAYQAYLRSLDGAKPPVIDGLTGPQRFFLSNARVWRTKNREAETLRLLTIDPHSPEEFRANVVRNLEEFYAAFDVVEGDALWLPAPARVRIW